MPRYFFDFRDGHKFIRDDDGFALADIEEARDQATATLARMAKDAVPKSARRELAIEVRDEDDRQVIRASLWFEVQVLA